MNKLAAQIKIAEINGVMGALMDADLVKIASEEDYGVIAEAIASKLPEDWDMDTMLAAVDEVMGKYNELMDDEGGDDEDEDDDDDEMEAEKTAAEAALGRLTMAKVAGEISDEDFEKEAASINDALGYIARKARGVGDYDWSKVHKDVWGGIKGAPGKVKDHYKNIGTQWDRYGDVRNVHKANKKRLKEGRGFVNSIMKGRHQKAVKDSAKRLKEQRNALLKALAPELVAGSAGAAGLGAYAYNKYND